jgi:hypothetical protein
MIVIGVNSFLSPGPDSEFWLDSVKPVAVPGLLMYAYWVRMDWLRAVLLKLWAGILG